MKILWVVNTIFPDAAIHLGMEPSVFGGWMYGLARDLANSEDVDLAVATIFPGAEFRSFCVNGIRYFLIPQQRGKAKLKDSWLKIVSEFAPDLVHIHGTEFGHGMMLMNACSSLKYVVSIQGLVSVYYRYFLAGLSVWEVLGNITFRDVVRWNTLFHAKHDFYKRGQVEQEYIRRANAVIGRTDWDRAHSQAINPKVSYHFCNESLRDEFYSGEKWSLGSCRQHSIFLSQAAYPIKGLHQVLKAVAQLKDSYPDILVEVAGYDITNAATLKSRLKRSGYGRYIDSMIRQYGLEKHVKFLGPLRADEMKKAYLRSNIFVCPSSIENSPNSLGEAQILGVPCIAAYCGGVPSMVENGKGAVLYPFDEYEMLSFIINKVFSENKFTEYLSENGAAEATVRHNRLNNLSILKNVYSVLVDV